MLNNKKKTITLRAFSVNNVNISQSKSNLFKQLKNKLESSNTANDRAMVANHEEDNGEKSLISYYDFIENPNSIFCLVMHIAPGAHHEAFSEELLNKNKIKLEDITNNIDPTKSLSCLKSYYFLLYDDLIIVNIPTNQTIKNLQIYLNWFTKNNLLELLPIINTDKIKLSEIKSIYVEDNSIKQYHQQSLPIQETKTHTISLKDKVFNLLQNIIPDIDTQTLNEIVASQIISAKLSVEFNQPKTMSDANYKNTLAAIIKPVSDVENYTYVYKNGTIAKPGKDIVKSTKVLIQTTQNGNLNEQELMQEMIKFAVNIKQNDNIH